MPKISVIVPVYKVGKYLNRCVDSILNQTFKDFEIILVDDGSPDNCPAICDDYAAKYNFVHVIHKQNGGLSDARNFGIDWAFKNSDSEYITFIDSDDWVHPQYLEILYNACIDNDVAISCCPKLKLVNDFYIENVVYDNVKVVVGKTEDFYCKNITDITVSVCRLYNKTLFDDIRFPCGKIYEDSFTTYKALFKVNKIAVVSVLLYYYFQREDSIMHSRGMNNATVLLHSFRNQIDYFICNNYYKAFYKKFSQYVDNYHLYLEEFKEERSFDAFCREEKKKLKKIVRKYQHYLDFNLYDGVYKEVFSPITVLLYKLDNKIKNFRKR